MYGIYLVLVRLKCFVMKSYAHYAANKPDVHQSHICRKNGDACVLLSHPSFIPHNLPVILWMQLFFFKRIFENITFLEQ